MNTKKVFENQDLLKEISKYLSLEPKTHFNDFCKNNNFECDILVLKNLRKDIYHKESVSDIIIRLTEENLKFDEHMSNHVMECQMELEEIYIKVKYNMELYCTSEECHCCNQKNIQEENENEENENEEIEIDDSDEEENWSDIEEDEDEDESEESSYEDQFALVLQPLHDLIDQTYFNIFIRQMVELIENSLLSSDIIKNPIDQIVPDQLTLIHMKSQEYYAYCIVNDIDINSFCHRCGAFGHSTNHHSCIFYSEHFTKNKILELMNLIKNTVVFRDEHNKYLEERKCSQCKLNISRKRCMYNKCGLCCVGHKDCILKCI